LSDFSRRFGYVEPVADLSEKDMPDSLRAGIWDATRMFFMEKISSGGGYDGVGYSPAFEQLSAQIWFQFFRKPIDSRPRNPHDARKLVREKILYSFEFHEVYSFIEFLAELNYREDQDWGDALISKKFVRFCNNVLERERASFRFVGPLLVKITDEEELAEIHSAIAESSSVGVRKHISAAAEKYSSTTPDYRNSIKEAISAVESAAYFLLGEKTDGLRSALKKISARYIIHPAMQQGFEKLYGYTSDQDGIRHAILEEKEITQSEARYMLISCSAFANYLVSLRQE